MIGSFYYKIKGFMYKIAQKAKTLKIAIKLKEKQEDYEYRDQDKEDFKTRKTRKNQTDK